MISTDDESVEIHLAKLLGERAVRYTAQIPLQLVEMPLPLQQEMDHHGFPATRNDLKGNFSWATDVLFRHAVS